MSLVDLSNPGYVFFGNLYKTGDHNDGFLLNVTTVNCESDWI